VHSEAYDSDHPDHDVGEKGDPDAGHDEGDEIPAAPPLLAHVWHGDVHDQDEG